MTSAESMVRRSPSSSMYWNSSWPGSSWMRLTMRASCGSRSLIACSHAALAAEMESHLAPADLDMAVAQRGQAEGLVGPRIFLVADADQRRPAAAPPRSPAPSRAAGRAGPVAWLTRWRGCAAARCEVSMRSYLVLVAHAAPVGHGSGTACGLFASRPVAWIWPFGFGQIHTSVQAGGIARRGCA